MKHILAMANNCTECVMPGHEDERRLAIVWRSDQLLHLEACETGAIEAAEVSSNEHVETC